MASSGRSANTGSIVGRRRQCVGERQQRLRRAGRAPPPGKSDDMVLKFTQRGKIHGAVRPCGRSKGDADHANVKQAADMQVFKGELFVADGYGNHRVAVLDAKTGEVQTLVEGARQTVRTTSSMRSKSPLTASSTSPTASTSACRCSRLPAFKQEPKVGGENNQM